MFFSTLFSFCKLSQSEIVTLIAAAITGLIAAMGAVLAVSLDYFRTKRERKNKIQDKRNLFRTDVVKYLEGREKELIQILDDPNNRDINEKFINDILEKFENDFFSNILLENKKVYDRINEFTKSIKELLSPSEKDTCKKCLSNITSLIEYLRDELKKARRK